MSSLNTTENSGFGLSLGAGKPKKAKRKISNAFGDDAEDGVIGDGADGDNETSKRQMTYRERVNAEMKQKSAIAARKMEALQAKSEAQGDEAIYDYDSFAAKKQEEGRVQQRLNRERQSAEGGKSQYIVGLMSTAKVPEKEKRARI